MTRHRVEQLIARRVLPHRTRSRDLVRETRLTDLGLDSLELLGLIVELETELSMTLDTLEVVLAMDRPTVGSLIDAYEAQVAAG